MELDAVEIANVLKRKGVRHLYHANTVRTACTFLQERHLLSRGEVESNNLMQTPQDSDDIDKRFDIWNDIFFDSVDIHERSRRRNYYGPVLFVFDIDILESAEIASVAITRDNPIRWRDSREPHERYYHTPAEFAAEFTYGDFSRHITLRENRCSLEHLRNIIVDDVDATNRTGNADLFSAAIGGLVASKRGVRTILRKRACNVGCTCQRQYNALDL